MFYICCYKYLILIMELTDANSGDKYRIIRNPIWYCKLFTPKYLHDYNTNFIINKNTSVMLKFCLN